MANENEEIIQNNNETENEQQTTIGGKSGKATLQGTTSPSPQITTNGEATDNRQQTKYAAGQGGGLGDYKNIRATTHSGAGTQSETHQKHPQQQQPARREENPFSLKHFLNWEPTSSCSGSSASSSFVISSTTKESSANNNDSASAGAACLSQSSLKYQTSTGARPKVPQSSSSSLIGNSASNANGNNITAVPFETSKMKRSPRFSSFDSQASLAEYAASGSGVLSGAGSSSSAGINTHSSPSFRINQNTDDDVPSSSGGSGLFSSDNDRQQFVPRRSYSNYDMDVQPSPRRRAPETARSNRGYPKPQSSSHHHHHSSASSNPSVSGQRPSNAEFAPAAALPDFVQDHWMDPWHCADVNLNSSPNSPNSPIDFVEDITGGAANATAACNNSGSTADNKCQTLPDFLSDGPIIHSSQRLADVAAGLPSAVNWSSLDSPEDDSPSLQLSRLRLENERLCIELNETRLALSEQTRRSNDLERTLEQTRNIMEQEYNRNMAQNIELVEENLDQSKKRTAAAQNQVAKLNLQIKQLMVEVNTLRRENDSLRDGDGAVGGSRNDERPSGSGTSSHRPSRSHRISRELRTAASTAESNLRQLLTGVENLRQLAADLETRENRFDYDEPSSYPPMTDDFLDVCDDYDEFTGGPAL